MKDPLDDPNLGLAHLCESAFDSVADHVLRVRRNERVPSIPVEEKALFLEQAVIGIKAALSSACASCVHGFNGPSLLCLGEDPFEKIASEHINMCNFPDDMKIIPDSTYLLTYSGTIENLRRIADQFSHLIATNILKFMYGEDYPAEYIKDNLYFVIFESIKNSFVHGNQRNDFLNVNRSVIFSWSCKRSPIGNFRVTMRVGDHGSREVFDEFAPRFPPHNYERSAVNYGLSGNRRGLGEIRSLGFTVDPPRGIFDKETREEVGKVVSIIGDMPKEPRIRPRSTHCRS